MSHTVSPSILRFSLPYTVLERSPLKLLRKINGLKVTFGGGAGGGSGELGGALGKLWGGCGEALGGFGKALGRLRRVFGGALERAWESFGALREAIYKK